MDLSEDATVYGLTGGVDAFAWREPDRVVARRDVYKMANWGLSRESARKSGWMRQEQGRSPAESEAGPGPGPTTSDAGQAVVEDGDLARRVMARDARAFVELYDRYAGLIYSMALHMLGSAEAEGTHDHIRPN